MSKKIAFLSGLFLIPSLFAGSAPEIPVVPEPTTLLLLAGGIGAAILLERKRRNKKS